MDQQTCKSKAIHITVVSLILVFLIHLIYEVQIKHYALKLYVLPSFYLNFSSVYPDNKLPYVNANTNHGCWY